MRLALPLHLQRFEERLPSLTVLGPLLGHRVARECGKREHAAVGQVAVMRNREHLPSGLLFPGRHPFPQVLGVFALERRHRQNLLGLRFAVPVNHVAMQVVAAAGVGRPLVGDKRREPAGLVVLLLNRDVLVPDCLGELRVHDQRWQLLGGLGPDQFHNSRIGIFAALGEQVMPPLDGAVLHHLGIARFDLGDDAHAVGVVGHGDPIERLAELHRLTAGRHDFFSASEPHRLLGSERRSGASRIHRPGRVNVFVPKIDALGIVATGIGGIARGLVELARIGRLDFAGIRERRARQRWRWTDDFGLARR